LWVGPNAVVFDTNPRKRIDVFGLNKYVTGLFRVIHSVAYCIFDSWLDAQKWDFQTQHFRGNIKADLKPLAKTGFFYRHIVFYSSHLVFQGREIAFSAQRIPGEVSKIHE